MKFSSYIHKTLLLCYSLLVLLASSCNGTGSLQTKRDKVDKGYGFSWISGGVNYDTAYLRSKVVTTIKFLDGFSLEAEFKYDSNFSFFYPEYFINWRILRDGKCLNYNTEGIDWAYYFYTSDSILTYKVDNLNKYYLVFNKPFYCNGFSCNDIGVLILKQQGQNDITVRYYNSKFGNNRLLVNSIEHLSKREERLVFPVLCDNLKPDSVCSFITVDSVK